MIKLPYFVIVLGLCFSYIVGFFFGGFLVDRKQLLTIQALRDMVQLYRERWERTDMLLRSRIRAVLDEMNETVTVCQTLIDFDKDPKDLFRVYQRATLRAISLLIEKVKPNEKL